MNGTPTITPHARERCAEMGISTKVAKRLWRNPSMILPDFQGNPNRSFIVSEVEPLYAIVVDGSIVITVLYRSAEPYTRPTKEKP